MGCPIRKSLDQRLFAPTQGLSQLITSFIASVSQGIRHAPFLTFFAFFVIAYKECSSYFQLLCDSKEFEVFSSIIRMLILPIIERIVLHYSLACVNMSKILCCHSLCSEAVPQKQKTAKWRITDSNRWPPACKAGALANWANPPRDRESIKGL